MTEEPGGFIQIGLAPYRLRGIPTTDEELSRYSFCDPVVDFKFVQSFVEVIPVQPGMRLQIVRIPAGEQLSICFDIQDAPISFECWLSGAMDYSYVRHDGGGTDRCRAGSLLFGSAGTERGIARKVGDELVEVVQLMIDPSLLRAILARQQCDYSQKYRECLYGGRQEHYFASVPLPPSVLRAAQSIAVCRQPPPLRQLMLARQAHALFYQILLELCPATALRAGGILQPSDVEKLRRVRELIEANLHQPLSHHRLARAVGINEFKLKTGFKELFGNTVYGYLLERRMCRSRELLESGTHSVSAVAWDMGYTNVSHFINLFRRHHGLTPGKFLSSIRQQQLAGLQR